MIACFKHLSSCFTYLGKKVHTKPKIFEVVKHLWHYMAYKIVI